MPAAEGAGAQSDVQHPRFSPGSRFFEAVVIRLWRFLQDCWAAASSIFIGASSGRRWCSERCLKSSFPFKLLTKIPSFLFYKNPFHFISKTQLRGFRVGTVVPITDEYALLLRRLRVSPMPSHRVYQTALQPKLQHSMLMGTATKDSAHAVPMAL